MPPISAQTSYERRVAVWDLRDRGLGYKAIARELNLDINSVRHYCKAQPGAMSPQSVIDSVLRLKADPEYSHLGPLQLSVLASGGDLVSESTLSAAIKAAGLANKGLMWRGGSRPYWMDAKWTNPHDCFQADTVKPRTVADGLIEVFSIRDVITGLHWLSIVDSNNLSGCLQQAFQVLGVPRMLQCDNGFGMISNGDGGVYSAFQKVAWVAGVERIHYLPEAEPDRNGSVESFHRWLQLEYLHRPGGQAHDVSSLCEWIGGRLAFYNVVKPLAAHGGKGNRKSPRHAFPDVLYDPCAVSVPSPASVSMVGVQPGILSYTRLVDSRGAFVVRNPGLVVALGKGLGGHYVRMDVYHGGQARFFSRSVAESGVYTYSKVNGRRVSDYDGEHTYQVARADLDWCCGRRSQKIWVAGELLDESGVFSAVFIDEQDFRRRYAKAIRKPMPSSYPRWVDVHFEADGTWQWVDTRTGEIIASDRTTPDHAGEE